MQPGARIGPYRVVAFIGAGGMGEVYRARDERLERDVALKVLPAESLADDAARARLLREARMASRLNHPNVCTIHEVGESDGQTFIAMELVEGESLAALLARGQLPLAQTLRLGLQLADALAHAHERGVVHRDFKCGNVVITPEGRAKVLDFGLAKRVAGKELAEATTLTQGSLTAPGAIVGTLAYMAPEQLRGQPADSRSDIWALGVVLYEMAAGQRPFRGSTGFEITSAILKEPPAPLPPAVVHALAAVIQRCLAKEPGQRYRRGDEALAALQAVTAGTTESPWPGLRASLARQRWRVLLAAVSAAVAVLAGLDVGGLRSRLVGGAPSRIDSLAVLPLENLSGDPEQEYLAAGMHDALITDFAKLGGLKRVIARSSVMRFKGASTPLRVIAQELKVAALITGAVARSGDQVRVTAQLIDPATGSQLWAHSYERAMRDVLSLQDDIVAAISREVKLKLTTRERDELATARTVGTAAYEAYLKGMFFLNKETPADLEKGLVYLHEAVEDDPADPLAYAGLALGYIEVAHGAEVREDSLQRAKAAARTALRLDGELAEALAANAMISGYFEWLWDDAQRDFERALDINPNLAIAYYHRAWFDTLFGRMDEAITDHKRAQELDPFNPGTTAWLGELYRWAGRLEEAEAEARKSIAMAPGFPPGHYVLGLVYEDQGRHDEAIAAMAKAGEADAEWRWALGPTYAAAGRTQEARKLLAELNAEKPTAWGAFWRVRIHMALGEVGEAFRWLEYEPHHAWLPWLLVEPFAGLPGLRKDPRYPAQLARMHLPPARP